MNVRRLTALLAASVPALLWPGAAAAHELPFEHSHPHPDSGISFALALLLGIGVAAIAMWATGRRRK